MTTDSHSNDDKAEAISNVLSSHFERIFQMQQTMRGNSDRAFAIIGAAYADSELQTMFEKYMNQIPAVQKRFFGSDGAASAFSAKIDLALLLGLISECSARDLHIIRRVMTS